MRINSSPQISFKGYDAAPIKNIYMMAYTDDAQRNILKELTAIEESEKFQTSIEHYGALRRNLDGCREMPEDLFKWAQDNKVFMNSNGKTYLLSPQNQRIPKHQNNLLGGYIGVETKKAKTLFAGGNIFLGKKPDGEKYILIGQDVIDDTAVKEYFLDYGHAEDETYRFINFKKLDEEQNKESYKISPTPKEFNERKEEYTERAINDICEDFDVKRENIFTVPQQIYHIDMFLRPIGYPYILVNNKELSKDMVKDNLGFDKKESKIKEETEKYYFYNENISTKEVIDSLKKQGFIPIEIGGIFGIDGIANFMNAIVNKHPDGSLSYITNSSECEQKDYTILQSRFDEQLKAKVPNITTYYITGGQMGQINSIMDNLYELGGGIHCLTCEEPDFEAWG